jgi:hypothetical protein
VRDHHDLLDIAGGIGLSGSQGTGTGKRRRQSGRHHQNPCQSAPVGGSLLFN